MRWISLALVAATSAIASAHLAFAADMPTKAPVAAPAYSWTGFYIGGNIGYGTSSKDWTDISAATGLPTGFLASSKPDGFFGGAQAGYNYQVGQWVVGVEGQFSWTDMKSTTPWIQPNGAVSPDERVRTVIHALATLTGRFGVAWDRALLYAKGGAAWVDEDHWQATAAGVPTTTIEGGMRAGWIAGIGVEYAFWDHWSAKIEYNYMDFGSHRYSFAELGIGRLFPSDIDQNVQVVLVGINYKF